MSVEEAFALLARYAADRPRVDDAVWVLHRAKVQQIEIVRVSGLSRTGVQKILARKKRQAPTPPAKHRTTTDGSGYVTCECGVQSPRIATAAKQWAWTVNHRRERRAAEIFGAQGQAT